MEDDGGQIEMMAVQVDRDVVSLVVMTTQHRSVCLDDD